MNLGLLSELGEKVVLDAVATGITRDMILSKPAADAPPGNPHKISGYEYEFRVRPEAKLEFRIRIPQMVAEANIQLVDIVRQKPHLGRIEVRDANEYLIGGRAGIVRLDWFIESLGVLDDPDIHQVMGQFDGELRERFLVPHSLENAILGVIQQPA